MLGQTSLHFETYKYHCHKIPHRRPTWMHQTSPMSAFWNMTTASRWKEQKFGRWPTKNGSQLALRRPHRGQGSHPAHSQNKRWLTSSQEKQKKKNGGAALTSRFWGPDILGLEVLQSRATILFYRHSLREALAVLKAEKGTLTVFQE